MLRQGVDTLLGTAVLIALLPVVILSAFHHLLKPARIHRSHKSGADFASTDAATSAIGEFEFMRAIEAYEALIDELIGEASR